ncbi:hypothetical protein [Paraburkholderia sediminicola]
MDEIGRTATAFNALLARVAEVVGEIRGSAGSVSDDTQGEFRRVCQIRLPLIQTRFFRPISFVDRYSGEAQQA